MSPPSKTIGRAAERSDALAKLEQSLGRVEEAFYDLEREIRERKLNDLSRRPGRLPSGKPFRFPEPPRGGFPRLPRPRIGLPLPDLTDIIVHLAVPGYRDDSGTGGPCFQASCIGSFVRGAGRVGCGVPPPYCFAPLPIGVMPGGYGNYQAAVAGDGIGYTHFLEWWTDIGNPAQYIVGRIWGPMDPNNPQVNVGDLPGIDIPYHNTFPPGFPGALIVDPNTVPSQRADPRDKPWDAEDPIGPDPAKPKYRVISFGTSPGAKPGPARTGFRSPRPTSGSQKVREKKVSPTKPALYRGLMLLFDLYTESNDAVTAVWNALPRDFRCGQLRHGPKGNPYRVGGHRRSKGDIGKKAQDIWNNWDKIDIGQALLNLGANQLEDAVIGKSQKRLLELAGGLESNSKHAGVGLLRKALRDASDDMQALQALTPTQSKGGCK